MDHARLMGCRQPAGDLQGQLQDLGRRGPVDPQPAIKGRAAQKLHGQERIRALLRDLEHRDDVIVAQRGHHPSFAAKALGGQVGLGLFRPHDLEGDRSLQAGVLRPEHHGHAALAEQLRHSILSDPTQLIAIAGRFQEGEILGFGIPGRFAFRRRHGFPARILHVLGPDSRPLGQELPTMRTHHALVLQRLLNLDFLVTLGTAQDDHNGFPKSLNLNYSSYLIIAVKQ